MKRPSDRAEYSVKKIRKQEGAGQLKVLQFGDNRVQVIVDDTGRLWLCRKEVESVLNIRSVPRDIYDHCVRKNFFRILSDIGVRDRPALPATTSLIALEGVQMIERHSGQPKERQFIQSIIAKLNGVTVAESAQDDSTAREIERLRRENAEQRAELKRQAEAKRRDEKLREKLENCLRNYVCREPTQVVYIATTERYAAENIFKVGGVKSVDRLKSRRAVMNTGRTGSDSLYYCFGVMCSNHNRLEQRIADAVGRHRDAKRKDRFNEMYNLHFDDLKEVVEYLSDRSNEEDHKYNGNCDLFIRNLMDKPPAIPTVWTPNGAEERSSKAGEKPKAYVFSVDWDSLEEVEQWEFVEKLFDEFTAGVNSEGATRRDFEIYLTRQNIKFGKRKMWQVLKVVAKSRNISVKY